MAWVTDLQPTPGELSACVQCGLCLPHCPTFRLTGLEMASPRGRLAAMNAVADGIIALDDEFEEAMTFCLNCRACEAVCPSLVPYGRVMEGARAELTAQRPRPSRRWRHLLLGRLLPSRTVMSFATRMVRALQRGGGARLLPQSLRRGFLGLRDLSGSKPLLPRHSPVGAVRGRVGLLKGCVMEPWFPAVHEATVGVLTTAGYEVVIPDRQTCCGALAAHDGAYLPAQRMARRNLAAFAGCDLVVANAAGCSAQLKEYGHWGEGGEDLGSRVRDVTELVAELLSEGYLPISDDDRGPVAVQDPCHLRHAQGITAAPRRLLTAAGYRTVEVDPDGLCCGAAGTYSLQRPEAAAELGRRKADQIEATLVTMVASANPGCEMQLRSHLPPWYRVAHPIELYYQAVIAPAG